MPSFEVPGADAFFAYSVANERSHLALYHEFGDSIANARKADILFLGNSRMPMGLREDAVVPAARALGLEVFSLATGHSESVKFDLEVIRRQDLHPKVVVAVGGPNYYRDGMSPWGTTVAGMDRWQAWKDWFESGWRWSAQRAVHAWVPKLDWDDGALTSSWVIYRSAATGWWRPVVEPKGTIPVGFARERPSYEEILPIARELRDELGRRGAVLVLTAVPYQLTQSGHLPYLSDQLGVSAVLPDVDDLATSDGSHLTPESGRRYGRAFWDELISLPKVRERLGLKAAAKPPATVDRRALEAVRSGVLEMRAKLERYYGGPRVLRKTWYLGPDDPRYLQGVDYLADKLARALVWHDRFVIGTIGSSVVAGFDNCHYDTYQKQLERLMEPIWKAAGVAFEVRNTGQGGDCGDDFTNQVWCLRTLVGDDVDMTHYSWTYFEAGVPDDEIVLHHEMFYRWSLMMDRGPIPQLIYTGDCKDLRQGDKALLDSYGRFGANILCMERGIKTAGYPGKKWKVVGDGLHTTTRYGEGPGVSAQRRDSLGVVFRNWHPGPLLFQTTADALAYNLSDALLRAVEMIGNELSPTVRWPRRPRMISKESLPALLKCPAEWCGFEVPRCTVFEKPTFGPQFFRRLAPQKVDRQQTGVASGESDWVSWEEPDALRYVPAAERAVPECAHPARCAGLVAPKSQQAGWLRFELPDLRLGFIAVCCSRKECGQKMLDAGATFALNGEPPTQAPRPYRRGKCVEVQSAFASDAKTHNVQLGIHLPALEQPIPAITHIIGL